MAKFCGECGASLPAQAKFCLECGTPVGDAGSVTASRGQSVSVGRDVGRDALTAGRDVIIQSQGDRGQLVTCGVCNGTGLGKPVPCPDCGGLGYMHRGVLQTPRGCVRCGGEDKVVWYPDVNHRGKGNQGTGFIDAPCSACKGLGQVRL